MSKKKDMSSEEGGEWVDDLPFITPYLKVYLA
jgi:hypothetical protein